MRESLLGTCWGRTLAGALSGDFDGAPGVVACGCAGGGLCDSGFGGGDRILLGSEGEFDGCHPPTDCLIGASKCHK